VVDPLFEVRRYIHQHITLLEAPIEDSLKLRLMLSLYCHTVQMRDFYDLSANLLRITAGVPYAANPFTEDTQGRPIVADTVEQKASHIAEWASIAHHEEFGELVLEMVVPEVRQNFTESVYSLDERKMYYRPREGGAAPGACVIDLEWLLPRVNRGVAVALTFVDTAQRHLHSYQANKIVTVTKGGASVQMELVARGGIGLSGYRELPPDLAPPSTDASAPSEEVKPA
jgi:hypothetical protein